MSNAKEKHWLVRPKTIRGLWIVGLLVLAALAMADKYMHGHPSFGIDGTFGFYSWYGLVVCAAMVVFAKLLGFLLKRQDTYYDER
ncbi:MAG: hypothetical protein HOB79_18545 [Rhodospirillaceae bacterium]|jgi:hypothetical protein|nr:hypothetical protein [Rhodospirillaceae bacterium]MBT8005586.1 hypothetical protein [Rhodospirillales bacterium]MBT4703077.1 hypothetical protein [Rhodospirillaceae bacterium]MBT5034220.1 hypothetical protein [Rhodospirillaceae bacterium]MBT6220635.1 hypothetical protein [Rhodospirillaceae bacterium]